MRPLLFATTGIALFVFWAIAKPTGDATASMQEWPNVLWFSATLALLSASVAAWGRMVGGRMVVRSALLAAAGVGLSSIANIFEDGFRIDAAFFGFILGTFVHEVGLVTLTIAVALQPNGRTRLLALVPAGSAAGILLFAAAGGPILLVTWLVAAAGALRIRTAGRAAAIVEIG